MTITPDKQSGFILIDKPTGITSHDVVDKLRKLTGIKKIGHAGTLDPFATGLLIMAVGREATREISKFVGMDKTYEAEIVLGATTPSFDTETEVETPGLAQTPSEDQIRSAMQKLTGNLNQIPPMHSAIKIGGKRLYKSARQGQEVEVEPRAITVNRFDLISEIKDEKILVLHSFVDCSSGTYVRALARDLAAELKTVGYLRNLRRTSIGKFEVKNAIKIDDLNTDNWQKFVKSLAEMTID